MNKLRAMGRRLTGFLRAKTTRENIFVTASTASVAMSVAITLASGPTGPELIFVLTTAALFIMVMSLIKFA